MHCRYHFVVSTEGRIYRRLEVYVSWWRRWIRRVPCAQSNVTYDYNE